MNQTTRKILISALKLAASVITIILLWWLFAAISNNSLVLPQPWEVLKITLQLLGKGETYLALGTTLLRAVIAFCCSLLFGGALCLLVGVWQVSKPFVDGIVTVLRALPTIAIILIAMVALNSSLVPVVVAFLVAFPVAYSAFMRETESDEIAQMCKVYKVSAGKKAKYVLLPQMSNALCPQCHDSLPLCVKIVIAGEALSLPKLGLGQQMYVAKVNLLTANVLALTLLALIVCLALSAIFTAIQNKRKKQKAKPRKNLFW